MTVISKVISTVLYKDKMNFPSLLEYLFLWEGTGGGGADLNPWFRRYTKVARMIIMVTCVVVHNMPINKICDWLKMEFCTHQGQSIECTVLVVPPLGYLGYLGIYMGRPYKGSRSNCMHPMAEGICQNHCYIFRHWQPNNIFTHQLAKQLISSLANRLLRYWLAIHPRNSQT